MELLPAEYVRRGVFPVGRLDKETEGLLLFTNDGPAAHRILSPKHRVDKVYYAEHDGEAGEADVEAFRAGMVLRDGSVCRPAVLEPLDPGKSRITVQEGMYHQVRRMMAARGLHVNYLRREREADLTLDGVPIGTFRLLTPEEIQHLG
jgi:16S rRNA pseudouridine516 synthase